MTGHEIAEIVAIAVGYQVYRVLRSRSGDSIGTTNRLWILVGAAAGAAFGSHATEVLEAWLAPEGLAGLCYSGRSIVGALLGGLIAVESVKVALKEKKRSGDLFVLPVVVGMVIGRLGCYFDGLADCTYGVATAAPWGVDFGDGVARHPMQLYEIAFLAVLVLVLFAAKRSLRLRDGAFFQVFMIAYFAFRLLVDAWKPLPHLAGSPLAATQVVALLGLAWYWRPLLRPRTFLDS